MECTRVSLGLPQNYFMESQAYLRNLIRKRRKKVQRVSLRVLDQGLLESLLHPSQRL